MGLGFYGCWSDNVIWLWTIWNFWHFIKWAVLEILKKKQKKTAGWHCLHAALTDHSPIREIPMFFDGQIHEHARPDWLLKKKQITIHTCDVILCSGCIYSNISLLSKYLFATISVFWMSGTAPFTSFIIDYIISCSPWKYIIFIPVFETDGVIFPSVLNKSILHSLLLFISYLFFCSLIVHPAFLEALLLFEIYLDYFQSIFWHKFA